MERVAMESRLELVRCHAKDYQKATKVGKKKMLDVLAGATGYNRVYLARLLRGHGKKKWIRPGVRVQGDLRVRRKRRRPREYGPEVVKPLKQVWKLMDYACGKRLVGGMAEMLEALERHGELSLDKEVREKLLRMSASTVDRLLAKEKRRRANRLKSRTKPGSLLKSQIPIRTHSEWDENLPGFVEIDLVAHDGGLAQGDFAQTLDLTDVCTGWSLQRAVLNKAQRWVFEALLELRGQLPFALKGIDSDNGSEFINNHLKNYCDEEGLTFTRSRPYRKNDNCYVEQKNYSAVRRLVGYARYVGWQLVNALNALYEVADLRNNFFVPSMKLVSKERKGSRVRKRYDQARTPYQRVLEHPGVDASRKRELRQKYQTLNPVELERRIGELQRKVQRLARRCVAGSVMAAQEESESQKDIQAPPREKKGKDIQIHFT